eukprot:2152812-Amphidinium_carterae.1
MEANKFVDFIGLLPGNTMMQSDAEMAYVQATLKGCATWVRLPRDRCHLSKLFMDIQIQVVTGKSI